MLRHISLLLLSAFSAYWVRVLTPLHPMSLLLIPLIALLVWLGNQVFQSGVRVPVANLLPAILFSLFTVFSHYSAFPSLLDACICASVLVYPFLLLCTVLFDKLQTLPARRSMSSSRRHFFVYQALILLCWMPFVLTSYPGVLNTDSIWQIQQALGDAPLSDHHPVVHTLLLRALLTIGKALFNGNVSHALGLASIVQMLFLSACMAYTLCSMQRMGAPRLLSIGTVLFYGLVPFHAVFSITHLKDSWFAGFFLLFCSTFGKALLTSQSLTTADYLLVFISSIGLGLFRSNGLYLVATLTVCVLLFLRSNRKLCLAIGCALLICLCVLGPVFGRLQVISVDPVEYLSVPLQQISRIYADGFALSQADEQLLATLIDPQLLPFTYYARISDPIKNLIRDSGHQEVLLANKGAFFRLWLRALWQYPSSAFHAYVDLTDGFWFPESTGIPYVINSDPNPYGLSSNGVLPASVKAFFSPFYHPNQQQSALAPFYSCGNYVWLMLVLFFFSFRKGKPLFYLPGIFLWGTLLLTTPVYSDIRYLYAIIVATPLFLLSAFPAE